MKEVSNVVDEEEEKTKNKKNWYIKISLDIKKLKEQFETATGEEIEKAIEGLCLSEQQTTK